jgi:hypothetical protein
MAVPSDRYETRVAEFESLELVLLELWLAVFAWEEKGMAISRQARSLKARGLNVNRRDICVTGIWKGSIKII